MNSSPVSQSSPVAKRWSPMVRNNFWMSLIALLPLVAFS
jgi:hypothetical protein